MNNCKSFKPSIDNNSRILILGSMPGVKSLEEQQYYAHPQNRFWKVMSTICNEQQLPKFDYKTRLKILLNSNIALWDTIKSCKREGSLDSDIQNEKPNDIRKLLKTYPNIETICLNGNKSYTAFKKYFPDLLGKYTCLKMPSTSPANASGDNNDNEAWGGAIYNERAAVIGNINGNIKNNYAQGRQVTGGAVYNNDNSEIGDITGTFEGNSAIAKTSHISSSLKSAHAYGGAIYNSKSQVGDIMGDFKKNSATSENGLVRGGAIYNTGNTAKIGNITGNFVENSLTSGSTGDTYNSGGAIYNDESAEIGDIVGNFEKNTITAQNRGYGGAISNNNGAKISSLKGDFTENGIDSVENAFGGAIYNYKDAEITDIEGKFEQNYIKTSNADGCGGAIANTSGKISKLKGEFNNNSIVAEKGSAWGGALYNSSDVSTAVAIEVQADFNNNRIEAADKAVGGAVYNSRTSELSLNGNFNGNSAKGVAVAYGGAIYNAGVITSIQGDFTDNTVEANQNAYGGAIANLANMNTVKGSFINNSVTTNSNNRLALGGAVYTDHDITFLADAETVVFSGNKSTDSVRGQKQNAIFAAINGDAPTITLDLENAATMQLNDTIDGGKIIEDASGAQSVDYTDKYNLTVAGTGNSKLNVNNDIINANIIHNGDVTTTINNPNFINHAVGEGIDSLAMQAGTININNIGLTNIHLDNFDITGGEMNLNNIQVDLSARKMGRISAEIYNNIGDGKINVTSLSVKNDPNERVIPVLFADAPIKNNVTGSPVNEVVTPISIYKVEYDPMQKYVAQGESTDGGYFVFSREKFNPAVMAGPIATQLGAYSAMSNSYDYVFEHVDAFSLLPHKQRMAMLNQNKHAINDSGLMSYASNDLTNRSAGWVRPYAMFESVALRGAPSAHINSYGTLLGGDGELKEMRNGWARMGTVYAGYNGATITYGNSSIYQNGGILGITETWYKNNFWTALTISTGASVGEAHTTYGKEDITSLMAGIANKTGYNWEFKEGRYIIQPTLLTSYTFVNTFDYTNAAGVRIDSDPLHVIRLHPHIKFIMNTEKGWQPYFRVGVVANIMDNTKFEANDVRLSETSVKPYAEYGLGVQKRWSDRFTAWAQAMVRNGGRNGIALTAGFRWAFGKAPSEKVQKDNNQKVGAVKNINKSDKKVIKQMSRTSSKAVIKSL